MIDDQAPAPESMNVRNVTSEPQPLPGGHVLAPLCSFDVDPSDERIVALIAVGWLVETVAEPAAEPDDTAVEPEPQTPSPTAASRRRKPTQKESAS